MGRESWYRNTIWNDEIETAFRAKLSRSRSGRPQCLCIQAGYLADRYPQVSLGLIEEYFGTGDDFHVPSALCVRASALRVLGRTGQAIGTYKQALDWETDHPGLITRARMELPKFVAEERLSNEYDYALEILTTRFNPMDNQFPTTRYDWNGSCALILQDSGRMEDAREFAERALRAAAETQSPFVYHRDVGVVKNADDDFGRRIKRIVQPSFLRSLLRVLTGSN